MAKAWMMAVSLGLGLILGGGPAWAEVIAYPKKGQTQEQFQQDQYQCHQWAKGQTGVDPTKSQQSAPPPPPQQGGAVKGRPAARPSGPSAGRSRGMPARARRSGPPLGPRGVA